MQSLDELGPGSIGWIAGLLEGEGCFFLDNNSPEISASSTDNDTINKIYQLVGGRVRGPHHHKNPNPKWKPYWSWKLQGKPSINLMSVIYPLMSSRRQAKIRDILQEYSPRENFGRRGTRWSEEEREKRMSTGSHGGLGRKWSAEERQKRMLSGNMGRPKAKGDNYATTATTMPDM